MVQDTAIRIEESGNGLDAVARAVIGEFFVG